MAAAFGTFDEPHAWLIRGLIEYGWPDISRGGGHVPPGAFGGLDASRLPESEGREGLVLEVPAVDSQGRKHTDDGTYHFQVQVIRSTQGGLACSVRCPEANYIQEFAYDPANPSWAAGYIHQALTQYVPQFVDWRQQGGEVTWAQRQGIPELDGEPCSAPLAGWVRDAIRAARRFDRGPQEGWWLGQATVTSTGSVPRSGPPVPSILKGGAAAAPGGFAPPKIVAGGPIAVAGQGLAHAPKSDAQRAELASTPGTALLVMCVLGVVQGGMWFIDALSVVIWYESQRFALAVAAILALGLVPFGAIAAYGAWQARKGLRTPFTWVAVGYAALTPVCCLAGLPIAGWMVYTWRQPAFQPPS